MLIQILDPLEEFPRPLKDFKEIYRFEFWDTEDALNEAAITPLQAQAIGVLLVDALENRMNVIVHCHAGICRSGAVAEVGHILGFRDTEDFRCPNRLVKHSILKSLGLNFDTDEPRTANGRRVDDWEDETLKGYILVDLRREYERNRK